MKPLPIDAARYHVMRPSRWWDQCRGCGKWFPPTVSTFQRSHHTQRCRGAIEVPS
jgi:hypothetical protein